MYSLLPTSIEPTGAHRPLDRQNMTESAQAAISLTSTPKAVAALKMRAPSMWTGRPSSFAIL